MTIDAIKQEIKTFTTNSMSFVAKDRGRYVLIRKDEGTRAGYERLGNAPFLVKEILEEDRIGVVGTLE